MSNEDEVKLKHCPFCGKGQSQVELYERDFNFWIIGCGRCGSHSGTSKDKSLIIKSWNSRPHELEEEN